MSTIEIARLLNASSTPAPVFADVNATGISHVLATFSTASSRKARDFARSILFTIRIAGTSPATPVAVDIQSWTASRVSARVTSHTARSPWHP